MKKGTGTWHLKNNAASELSGPVCVEEGVLRHDTLASRGENCALGTAVNLHDGAYVAPASATAVDYAILFSGAGSGLLEYTGKYDACSTNRPVAVKTGGGFSSSGGSERIHGISAYDDRGLATLTILATNSAISTYADITDGTHGGKLGVTKRGGGTAEIDGELSFSGPLNVEDGKLIVRNSSGHYTWFRLVVKQNVAGRDSLTTDTQKLNQMCVERFALYDAEGIRQNIGFTRHSGNIVSGGYSSGRGHNVMSAASGLRPGEIGYDRPGNAYLFAVPPTREVQNLCDATDNSLMCYTRYDTGPTLSPSNPDSWIKYIMRLTNGTPEIVSFDIAARFGTSDTQVNNYYYAPAAWTLEGSVDGARWDVLTNMTIASGTTIAGKKWYSDMTTDCYGTTSDVTGKSFPIRGTPETPVSFNVLGACGPVSVAPGATLEKQGNGEVTIKKLKIDVSGFGTFDGFAFAADGGEIEVTGVDRITEKIDIHGTFANCSGLENIGSRWTVVVGDSSSYVVHGVSPSGLSVGPRGFLFLVR